MALLTPLRIQLLAKILPLGSIRICLDPSGISKDRLCVSKVRHASRKLAHPLADVSRCLI